MSKKEPVKKYHRLTLSKVDHGYVISEQPDAGYFSNHMWAYSTKKEAINALSNLIQEELTDETK